MQKKLLYYSILWGLFSASVILGMNNNATEEPFAFLALVILPEEKKFFISRESFSTKAPSAPSPSRHIITLVEYSQLKITDMPDNQDCCNITAQHYNNTIASDLGLFKKSIVNVFKERLLNNDSELKLFKNNAYYPISAIQHGQLTMDVRSQQMKDNEKQNENKLHQNITAIQAYLRQKKAPNQELIELFESKKKPHPIVITNNIEQEPTKINPPKNIPSFETYQTLFLGGGIAAIVMLFYFFPDKFIYFFQSLKNRI